MSRQNYVFTSESVSEGHPDKVCDRISDAILDAFLAEDPLARVACETFATTNRVVIGGEVGLTDQDKLAEYMGKIESIARACIKDIGYEQDKFHHETCEVTNLLHEQSAHIAQGVTGARGDEGAGDQGIMFGYATNETEHLMPAPIHYAHAILRRLAEVRKNGSEPLLRPDAKSQITVRYVDGKPVGIDTIVLSTQHESEAQSSQDIRAIVEPHILDVLPEGWVGPDTEWWVNPTGTFVIGGPDGDARFDGAQDYCRYLWWRSPPWWWCFFRKRSQQGRSLGCLCVAVSGKKCCGCGVGGSLYGAVVLCHWRCQAFVDLC